MLELEEIQAFEFCRDFLSFLCIFASYIFDVAAQFRFRWNLNSLSLFLIVSRTHLLESKCTLDLARIVSICALKVSPSEVFALYQNVFVVLLLFYDMEV